MSKTSLFRVALSFLSVLVLNATSRVVAADAWKAGAAKMNVSTQIKQTYIDGLYVYVEGHRSDPRLVRALESATRVAHTQRILGSFPRAEAPRAQRAGQGG